MRLTSLRTAGLTLAVLLLCVAAAAPAKADSFTFTGTFTYDNDVRLFNFTVAAQSQVTLRTRSYAAGGFDPVLSLFRGDGQFLTDNDDPAPNVFDSLIVRALDSGNYILALTQSPNYVTGNNLSDGFTFDGDDDDNRTFADGFGGRTGNFTLDIENVAVATPVPEPATLMMFGGGVAVLAATLRRRRNQQQS